MPADSLHLIIKESTEVTLEPGQRVFAQGQTAENFLFVISGSVTVFARSNEGKEVVLYHVNPGEMCILTTACLIGHTAYPAEGITDSQTSAKVLPICQFERLMEESASFRQFVFKGFSDRLAQVTQRFEHLVLGSVRHRLSVFLLTNRDHKDAIDITHEKLAREIGTAREVISRQLKSMQSENLIRTERGRITVLDADRLALIV